MNKSKSTYLTFFFLFCFLASFSANTIRNFYTSTSLSNLKQTKSISVSSKEERSVLNADFLFEKNENETEDDFHAQSFLLPFFISFFQYEVLQTKSFSAKPIAENLSSPIYIAVCNFRI